MPVRIRLRQTGKRSQHSHRIVIADGRSPRDGRFIECIGTYDPRHKLEKIDLERVDYWLPRGAQPSETVDAIIKRARAGISWTGVPKVPVEADEPPAEETEPVEAEDAEEAEAAGEEDDS